MDTKSDNFDFQEHVNTDILFGVKSAILTLYRGPDNYVI